jgi:ankyrin repeat protein
MFADRVGHSGSLFEAVKRRDPNEVRRLVNAGANVNQRGKYGTTPLHVAAGPSGSAEIVEILIAHGAKIESVFAGRTPLHVATTFAKFEIAELLLANGADVNAQESFGLTPLHRAAIWPRKDLIELLLKNGANVDMKDEFGHTPLDIVLQCQSNEGLDIEERRKYQEIAQLMRKYRRGQ